MKRMALLCVLAIGMPALSHADSWAFEPKVTEKVYEFGESKIVLKVDATKDQQWPEHTLSIYLGDELMAQYKNVGFEQIFASPDNKYFLGVSNSGIPGTAFVIFDREGNLIREEKHNYMAMSIYTEISVTLVRTWYDSKNPGVEFVSDGDRLTKVLIRSHTNKTYNLLYRDREYRRFEEVEEEKNGG